MNQLDGLSYSDFCSAASSGNLDRVKFLADHIGTYAIRGIGDRAVIMAAMNGHLHIVEYLVENIYNVYTNHRETFFRPHRTGIFILLSTLCLKAILFRPM